MSAPCRLRKMLFGMIQYIYRRLNPVLEWFWSNVLFLWRFFVLKYRALFTYVREAIGWRQQPAGRSEPQVGDEVQTEKKSVPMEVDEPEEGEGQPEAVAGERAAPFDLRRPRFEEEEETEDEFDSEEYRVDSTDELYCEYDSTWEDEEDQESTARRRGALGRSERTRRPAASRYYKFSRFETAAKDMQNYRHGYPQQIMPQRWSNPTSNDKPNLNFYHGVTPSLPDGIYIHDFHKNWSGEYDALEYVHTYIQWLFPLQEPGVNCEASILTKEEIQDFLESSTAKGNLMKSYKLMLDFYGIELCNEETGQVRRASNWRERFNNLDRHTHNSLRITRILKCQGTLGFPHYQAPLVRFFLKETLVNGELPNIKDSVLNYFMFAVLDKRQRRRLIKFAYLKYDSKDEFVWCPKKIQMMWSDTAEAMEWSN